MSLIRRAFRLCQIAHRQRIPERWPHQFVCMAPKHFLVFSSIGKQCLGKTISRDPMESPAHILHRRRPYCLSIQLQQAAQPVQTRAPKREVCKCPYRHCWQQSEHPSRSKYRCQQCRTVELLLLNHLPKHGSWLPLGWRKSRHRCPARQYPHIHRAPERPTLTGCCAQRFLEESCHMRRK